MTRPVLLATLLAISATTATSVRADEPTTAHDTGAATAAAPRVRATHRVDVIAPGEKVESVIDRMRAQGAAQGSAARPVDAPATGERKGERPMDQRPSGAPTGGMMGPSGANHGTMPGMGPGTAGTGPRGDLPPPDRMRRR